MMYSTVVKHKYNVMQLYVFPCLGRGAPANPKNKTGHAYRIGVSFVHCDVRLIIILIWQENTPPMNIDFVCKIPP